MRGLGKWLVETKLFSLEEQYYIGPGEIEIEKLSSNIYGWDRKSSKTLESHHDMLVILQNLRDIVVQFWIVKARGLGKFYSWRTSCTKILELHKSFMKSVEIIEHQ